MKNINFKKGAASFYIVAFSTLILLIIATSFAAIIISELTRTSNDDLAQSAYDSAMAGIEDAKTAFLLYQQQCEDEESSACKGINGFIEQGNNESNSEESCYMVGRILGKLPVDKAGKEVVIREYKDRENNMAQAYTCVKLKTKLTSIDGNLTSSAPLWAIELNQENLSDIESVQAINIYWSKEKKDDGSVEASIEGEGANVKFPGLMEKVQNKQPIITFAMAQMGNNSSFDDFEKTAEEGTNRGTVFLVPVDNRQNNNIEADILIKSTDKTKENQPQLVKCNEEGCGVTVGIPKLVGDTSRTSMILAFALPYGGPNTALSFEACKYSNDCSSKISSPDDNTAPDS